MSNKWKEEKGNTVTVYDRYHFAVPVRGIITETNHNSFKVTFFSNNPGGHNVNKHDDTWFLKGQCTVDEGKAYEPEPKAPTHEEIMGNNKYWLGDNKEWSMVNGYNPSTKQYYLYTDENKSFPYKEWFTGRESADIPPEGL